MLASVRIASLEIIVLEEKEVVTNVESSQAVAADGTNGMNATADLASLVEFLAVTDSNDPSDSVLFQLTGLPQHGTLYLGERPLGLGETFSQFDIDNGVLTYQSSVGDLESGTYRAGDTTGLRADHYDFAWSGIDVFGVSSPAGADALDLATADSERITISAHGLGLEPSGAGDALVLDFRAEVSEARLHLLGGQEGTVSSDGRGLWEAYDASGDLVDFSVVAGTEPAADGVAEAVAIAAEDGASFRYLLLRTGERAVPENGADGSVFVRAVEFDVAPPPVADAFSFRAEGGQALDIGNSDPAALGYAIVDGEAIFSIALVPGMN